MVFRNSGIKILWSLVRNIFTFFLINTKKILSNTTVSLTLPIPTLIIFTPKLLMYMFSVHTRCALEVSGVGNLTTGFWKCWCNQIKIPHTGNTRPYCMCMIQDYWFYTMSLSQYHGCCQYHESLSIPYVLVNTMSPCQYHEPLSLPWVHVYTISMVQEVPKGPRGTLRSKRYLKVQEVPKGPRGIKRSKRYLEVQELPKGPKGT